MPLVSGTQRKETRMAKAHTAAQARKEPPMSNSHRKDGKICNMVRWWKSEEVTLMERKTVMLLRKAVMEVAAPRTLLGNSSPNRMKGTGPRPQA